MLEFDIKSMCAQETGMCWHVKFKLRSLILSIFAACLLLTLNYRNTAIYFSKNRYEVNAAIPTGRLKNIKTADTIQVNPLRLFTSPLNQSGFINMKNIGVDRQVYSLGKSANRSDFYTLFQKITNDDEKYALLETFETFVEACREHNITYMLYGGTMLGAYRHHGMIPWDDDIDIIVRSCDKQRLKDALREHNRYKLFHPPAFQWKLYLKKLKMFASKPFGWPYIDIFFYDENQTHIWDTKRDYSKDFCYRKSDVFPLQNRLFEGYRLPVPCNMQRVLSRNYEVNVCETTNFIHKHESHLPIDRRAKVPCDILRQWYYFVERTALSNGTMSETLRTVDSVKHTETIKNGC